MSKTRSAQEAAPATLDLVRVAGALALDKKAEHVVLLDLRAFPLNTDYFLIASGRSDVQVRAIADWIDEEMERRHGLRPWHVEGRTHGRWVLLDYVDWVVHIFHRETRDFYMLERLWGDASREELGTADPAAGAGESDDGEDEA